MTGFFIKQHCIKPNWSVPSNVHAYVTTRLGGVSQPPYEYLNLATLVNDETDAVMMNRDRLSTVLALPSQPHWLDQYHGVDLVELTENTEKCRADAAYTQLKNKVCAILTADCLPIFVAHSEAEVVAVIHAGWRGLASGIVGHMINALAVPKNELIAWLGPAIGPCHFEVGQDVLNTFSISLKMDLQQLIDQKMFFAHQEKAGFYRADLYQLARRYLTIGGVRKIYGGGLCTYCDAAQFYSYRRDSVTGRMASIIWFD